MNQPDILTIASLIVSVTAPVAAAVWYILANPKHMKKVVQTAIITVVIVLLLVGGVLYFSMSLSESVTRANTTTPGITQTAVGTTQTAVGTTQTAVGEPSPTAYTTSNPGTGCDANSGTWV